MEFIETFLFQKLWRKLLDDDQLRQLQMTLLYYPDMGAVISGSGGLQNKRT